MQPAFSGSLKDLCGQEFTELLTWEMTCKVWMTTLKSSLKGYLNHTVQRLEIYSTAKWENILSLFINIVSTRTINMWNLQFLGNDQRKWKRRFAIYEPPEFSSGTAVLFATEPKYKCRNVRMYHVYQTVDQVKSVAIIDFVNICTDISSVRRTNADESVWNILTNNLRVNKGVESNLCDFTYPLGQNKIPSTKELK